MKASELIFKLKELKEIHGDIETVYAVPQSDYAPWNDSVSAVEYVHEPLTHARYFRIS